MKKAKSKSTDGWISVKERLPDTSRAVLVHIPGCGMMTQDVWIANSWTSGWRWPDCSPVKKPVTHWREMPEPPKGKS